MELDFLFQLQELRESAPSFVTLFFDHLSEGVGGTALVLLGAVIFWCISKRAGYLMISAYLASTSLNQLVKNIACVYRPWILDSRIEPVPSAQEGATGYSFPSGHTTTATSTFGALAYWQRERVWLAATAVGLIVLTAFSRMWLGVHTPKDVIVAMILATCMVAVCVKVSQLLDKHPEKDVVVAAIIVGLAMASLVFCSLKTYPVDYSDTGASLVNPEEMMLDCHSAFGAFMSFGICWIVERRFVRFSVEGSLRTRIARAFCGIALLMVLLVLCSAVLKPLAPLAAYKFIKHALLVAGVVLFYPACFMAVRKLRKPKR